MRKIKFKKLKISWSKFFGYTLLIAVSSVILLIFLIALPLTEKLTDIVAFDINTSDEFWSKEYFLDLESKDTSDIRKTRNVLFKRLNNYNVEEVSIYQETDLLKAIVKTTKSETYVDELIQNPYRYSIVTRKDNIDFDDEDNTLAQYLEENYDETEFDSQTFRNIYITKLLDSSGEYSYFGLAKVWPITKSSFEDFLKEYEGEYVGINTDGFVTPIYISDNKTFAIPMSIDEESVELIDILYNSGTIPANYEVTSENTLEVEQSDIDYIEITIALFLSIIVIYLYTYFTHIYDKKMILNSLFTTLLSLSLFLVYLKISLYPIQTFILVITAVFIIILSNIIAHNKDSRLNILIAVLVLGIIFNILGIGYIKILGRYLLIIAPICYLSVIGGNAYINKVVEYFKQ